MTLSTADARDAIQLVSIGHIADMCVCMIRLIKGDAWRGDRFQSQSGGVLRILDVGHLSGKAVMAGYRVVTVQLESEERVFSLGEYLYKCQ